ncbi:hypothetical protein PT974_03104 [Cladobotryum mycophilum]|uniref:Uncharacterized protein n=1 Tax=Cladobotryum mycophilum TaxID=491253 RepID=A0ABR0SRC7_9HYPO
MAKIPTVFADASFTIIATRSFKASQGFLHDCLPPSVPVHRLPFPCRDNAGCFGFMYVEQDANSDYNVDVDIGDLVSKRVWCFEERLLSPRAFAYTSSTLRFYCRMSRIDIGDTVCRLDSEVARRLSIDWEPKLGEKF